MKHDYVVAVDNVTGEAVKVWAGGRFRAYNPDRVTQHKVYLADSPEQAMTRAEAYHRQLVEIKRRLADQGKA